MESVKWLHDMNGGPWAALVAAAGAGLPVPYGYVVVPSAPEREIRNAYEDLKVREKTHFVALRGPSHAVLNVIGPDQLIHTLRRLWAESPGAPLFVQRMVHATWCGKAQWHKKNLRIKANEGMLVLDPDTYLFNTTTNKCTRSTIEPKQRKTIRHVDGTTRTVERHGEQRTPMTLDELKSVADLAKRAQGDIAWVIDDQDRAWLISVARG